MREKTLVLSVLAFALDYYHNYRQSGFLPPDEPVPSEQELKELHEQLEIGTSAEAALLEFVNTVEATGGLTRRGKWGQGPVADPSWADLGLAYKEACGALGRKPKFSDEPAYAPEPLD